MKMARWRVLLPSAALVTVLTPALRTLPAGNFLPDPWLLLLLWAVPEPAPWSWRRPVVMVVFFGALRASVSAVNPFAGWAGYACALAIRHVLYRRLVDRSFLSRFLVGSLAALPLSLFDLRAALELGFPPDPIAGLIRALMVGVLWSTALTPGPYPGSVATGARSQS